jgi:hypothetical protein
LNGQLWIFVYCERVCLGGNYLLCLYSQAT